MDARAAKTAGGRRVVAQSQEKARRLRVAFAQQHPLNTPQANTMPRILILLSTLGFASAITPSATPPDIFSLLPPSTAFIASVTGLESVFSKVRDLYTRVAAHIGANPLRHANTTLKEVISGDWGLPLDGVDTNGTFIVRLFMRKRAAPSAPARFLTPAPLHWKTPNRPLSFCTRRAHPLSLLCPAFLLRRRCPRCCCCPASRRCTSFH